MWKWENCKNNIIVPALQKFCVIFVCVCVRQKGNLIEINFANAKKIICQCPVKFNKFKPSSSRCPEDLSSKMAHSTGVLFFVWPWPAAKFFFTQVLPKLNRFSLSHKRKYAENGLELTTWLWLTFPLKFLDNFCVYFRVFLRRKEKCKYLFGSWNSLRLK